VNGPRAALACAALVLVACTAVLDYPSSDEAAHCANGIDDDFDDLVDCDDRDCDGQCPEDSLATCTDGRDQDRDDLADGDDPACFPTLVVVPDATRCESVDGSHFALALASDPMARESLDFSVRTITASTTTLDGRPTASITMTGPGTMQSHSLLTGATRGIELSAWVVPPPGATLRVGVAPQRTSAGEIDPTTGGLFLVFAPDGQIDVQAGVARQTSGATGVSPPYFVQIAIHPDGSVLGLVNGAGGLAPPTSRIAIEAASIGVAVPMRFFVDSRGGAVDAPTVVAEVNVSRNAFDPCARPVPDDTFSAARPLLALAARADGTLCALSATGSLISHDEGVTFAEGGPLATSAPPSAGALVEAEGRLYAALAIPRPVAPTGLLGVELVESDDCVSWTPVASPVGGIPVTASERSVGIVRTAGETRALVAVQSDPPSLITFRPAGDGTFTHTMESLELPAFAESIRTGIRIVGVGDDALALLTTARGVEVAVRRGTGWAALGAPVVVPSGVVGTFDEAHVEAAALAHRSEVTGPRLYIAFGAGLTGVCPLCGNPMTIVHVDLAPMH
jgi:hypothetical protein